MNKIYLISFLFISFIIGMNGQQTVTGTVIDETGEPLLGASILEKGTTNGTITDIDGRYSITVADASSILEFSFTGFTTESFTAASNVLDVNMSFDAIGLEDIVITGYTAQKRKDITGSVSSVNLDGLEDVQLPSLQTALQGRASGVFVNKNSGTPGGGINVRVRGSTSINASNQPLYVVDGVPIIDDTNDLTQVGVGNANLSILSDLNPDDIESLEIIKDAATAAQYGSRAANGVVLITTKRGQAGKAQINVSASLGVGEPVRRIDIVDGPQYIEYITEVFGANIVGTEANSDWQDLIFRTAITQDYNFNISGGDNNTKYFASAAVSDEEGVLTGQNFARYSGRLNLNHIVSDRLSFGANMSYSFSETDQIQNDNNIFGAISTAILLPPVVPVFNDDGSFGSAFGLENPVAATTVYDNQVTRGRFTGKFTGRFNITDDLSAEASFSAELLDNREEIFEPRTLQSSANGLAQVGQIRTTRLLNEYLLRYNRDFGVSNLNLVGGAIFQEDDFNNTFTEAADFPTDQFTGLSSGAQPLTTAGGFAGSNLQSYLLSANYSYDGKYFVTGTFRTDGSSRFLNNQFGVFPGATVAWRLSEESFLQDGPFDDLKLRVGWGITGNNAIGDFAALQLFGGGANFLDTPGTFPSALGNPDLRWETTTSIDVGLDYALFNSKLSGSINVYQKDTDDLLLNRPIPTTSGFQTLLQNVGEIRNRGIEFDVNYAVVTAGDFQWTSNFNIGFNENEVLSLVDDIPFDVGFASRVAVGQPLGSFFGAVTDGIFQNQGEVDAHATQTGGTAPGDFRFADISGGAGPDGVVGTADDLAPDGIINDNDRTFIGKALPDWTGGLTNTFSYKGFDLSAFFQFAVGFQIYNNNLAFAEGLNSVFAPTTNAFENRWQNEGDITNIPRIVNGDPNGNRRDSDRFVEDGDYLRLKTATFGYSFPSTLLDKINVRKLRVFVSGSNLLTFTGYSWFDPEVSTFNNNNASLGTDFLTTPQARTIIFGINVGF